LVAQFARGNALDVRAQDDGFQEAAIFSAILETGRRFDDLGLHLDEAGAAQPLGGLFGRGKFPGIFVRR
jgi:hypothetical protein